MSAGLPRARRWRRWWWLAAPSAVSAAVVEAPQVATRSWAKWALLASRRAGDGGVECLLAAASTRGSNNFDVQGTVRYDCAAGDGAAWVPARRADTLGGRQRIRTGANRLPVEWQ